MIEFEYQGVQYQARARRMVKHWHVFINEVGRDHERVQEMLAEGLGEADALKKGIMAFFGKDEK